LIIFSLFSLVLTQTCPSGVCSDHQTCCSSNNDGGFGCCPYSNAECCSDQIHCCPSGYSCDVSHSRCVKDELESVLFTLQDIKQCLCSSTETCCDFGEKTMSCCPNGCDLVNKRCMNQINELSSLFVEIQLPKDECPTNTCSDSETCCEMSGGQYGCCPYPSAVCCSDERHCCPGGYRCDENQGQCIDSFSDHITSAFVKLQPPRDDPPVHLRDCPASTCPDTETCCLVEGSQYGCCPYPSAICCTDMKHCCPSGYTCDVPDGQCNPSISLPYDICPSGTCPSGETCCDTDNGQFGCCPYVNAECCTDHQHCCPKGYTCDTVVGQCKKSTKFAFLQELGSKALYEELKEVEDRIQ